MALSKAHSSIKSKCLHATLAKAKVNSCMRPQSRNISKRETKFVQACCEADLLLNVMGSSLAHQVS